MLKNIRYKSQMFFCFILLTLILVVSLGFINYINSRKLMTNASRAHTTDMLIQLKNTNDLLVQNMEQTLRGSSSYAELELFVAHYPEMLDYHERTAIFERVADVLKLNTYFTACYVYYPQQGMIIDINSRTPSFSSVNQNKNGSLVNVIYKQYKAREEKNKTFLCPVIRTGGNVEWFMAVPVQYSSWIVEAPLMIVAIENSCFFQSLNTLTLPEDAQVFIDTPQGKWIGEQQPEDALMRKFNQETKNTGNFIYSSEKGKHLVVYTQSSQIGWRYLCSIPLKTVYSQVRFLAYIGLITAVLCVAAGIALAKLLSMRLYTPIERLSGRLQSETAHKQQSEDAFNSLYEGVDNLLSKNAQMQNKLKEHDEIVKNAFLFQLLQDDTELDDSYYERFESYCIPFRENMRYLVAIISMEQENTLHFSYENRQKQWEKELVFEQTLKEELCHLKGLHMETVSLEGYSLAVIFGIEDSSFSQKEMAELLQSLQQNAQDRLDFPVTLGFSRMTKDVANLPELNRQAHAAVEQQFFWGNSRAIGFDELPKEITEAYRYPWNAEKMVLSGLRQGQFEQACQAIDDFEKFVLSKIHDTKQSRIAFLHLCTDMIYVQEEFISQHIDVFTENVVYQRVLECTNLSEIVKCLKDYSLELCETINEKKVEHNNDIADSAIKFIEKNYDKPQMDLEALSRELGFSVSYISKMFKSSKGISVKEYITQKRVDKACALLQQTDMKVWEIGSNVGYDQQRSFLEIFKKYKGLTPSDYRKRHGGQEKYET